jgi:predicted enzyme related to lactoylglutathione lyase
MRSIGLATLALSLATTPALATPKRPAARPAPIVFFDIAAPDLASQAKFYKAVFGWTANPAGGLSVPVTSPLPGNLRVEPPSNGPTTERVLYVGVPDIDSTLAKVTANGGSVVFGRMAAPGVVILALFKDPAGNRMGLVELNAAGKPKVPPRLLPRAR